MFSFDVITADGHKLCDGDIYYVIVFRMDGDDITIDRRKFNQAEFDRYNQGFGTALNPRPKECKKGDYFSNLRTAKDVAIIIIQQDAQSQIDSVNRSVEQILSKENGMNNDLH